MKGLYKELMRRNVFRVGAAYAVIGWILAEVGALLFETFEAPVWVMKVFATVIILGFPLALFFAWAFEMTPEGLKREKDVDHSQAATPQSGRKFDFVIIFLLAVALVYFVYESRFILRVAGGRMTGGDLPPITGDSGLYGGIIAGPRG